MMIGEWVLKFLVHVVWRHRRELYYLLTAVSLAGNIVVLAGGPPGLYVPSSAEVTLGLEALNAVKHAFPRVLEVLRHRSVLFLVLNVIVVRIVVKSGSTSHVRARPLINNMIMDDKYNHQSSSTVDHEIYPTGSPVDQKAQWTSITLSVDVGSALERAATTLSSCGALQAAAGLELHETNLISPPHRNIARPPSKPSLFLIDTLEDDQPSDVYPLVVPSESEQLLQQATTPTDEQPWVVQSIISVQLLPLRKISSYANLQATLEPTCLLADVADDDSSQPVRPRDGCPTSTEKVVEYCESELSAHEFNERVDNFISRFKRQLSMQRQDSLTRLS